MSEDGSYGQEWKRRAELVNIESNASSFGAFTGMITNLYVNQGYHEGADIKSIDELINIALDVRVKARKRAKEFRANPGEYTKDDEEANSSLPSLW